MSVQPSSAACLVPTRLCKSELVDPVHFLRPRVCVCVREREGERGRETKTPQPPPAVIPNHRLPLSPTTACRYPHVPTTNILPTRVVFHAISIPTTRSRRPGPALRLLSSVTVVGRQAMGSGFSLEGGSQNPPQMDDRFHCDFSLPRLLICAPMPLVPRHLAGPSCR